MGVIVTSLFVIAIGWVLLQLGDASAETTCSNMGNCMHDCLTGTDDVVPTNTTETETLPTFDWVVHHVKPGAKPVVPKLQVKFASGYQDVIIFREHKPIPPKLLANKASGNSKQCLYLGKLDKDPRSSVAVTGCVSDKVQEITLLSSKEDAQSGLYRLTRFGQEVERVKPPAVNDGQLLFAPDYRKQKVNANRSNITIKDVPKLSKLEYYGWLDNSIDDRQRDIDDWIEEVLTHTQAFLLDLKFPAIKMELNHYLQSAEVWTADGDPSALHANAASHGGSNDFHIFFCGGQNSGPKLGMAPMNGICHGEDRYHWALIEWQASPMLAGVTLAHEIGHSLGIYDDDAPQNEGKKCSGIMSSNYGGKTWSKCSLEDQKKAYLAVVERAGKHCMETLEESNGRVAPGDSLRAQKEAAKRATKGTKEGNGGGQ